jgi:hypothetical protein
MPPLEGLVWLLLMLGPLLVLQRRLHFEIQAVFLLTVKRADLALVLFSLLFFPGVLLHETSHYLMARLLGVRTGRFSLLPTPLPGGRLRLGYVETARTDVFRDFLVGAAPLLAGGLFVAYAGLFRLELGPLWQSLLALDLSAAWSVLGRLHERPDFWLWFYLTFAVSSTMTPSPSDRRAWLPMAFIFGVLALVSLLVGAGPWLTERLADPLNRAFFALAAVFGVALLVHLALLPPFWLARRALSSFTGMKVA